MHCLLSQLSQDLGDRPFFKKRSMTTLISLRPLPADRVQRGKFSLLQETYVPDFEKRDQRPLITPSNSLYRHSHQKRKDHYL